MGQLRVAKSVFGLSNVLMLLNGLLKYRHPDFTNDMLDEIERMIHWLDEDLFLIPAKVAAIRATRLATPTAVTAPPVTGHPDNAQQGRGSS